MEKLGINVYQLLAQGVNFLILMFVLKKFLLKPMLALLEKRKVSIADQTKAEEDLAKRIKDYEHKDQQVLKQAKLKADEIIKQAQAQAGKEAAEILNQARQNSKKVLTQADKDAKSESEKSKANIQALIIKQAVVLANRALSEFLSKADQKKITEIQIARLIKGK
jgi:F-type H+-transporting ATPase subunit b